MIAFIPGMGTLNVSMGSGGGGEHIEMSNLTTARFVQLLLSSDGDSCRCRHKTDLKGSYEASFDIAMGRAPPPPPPPGGGGGGEGPALAAPRVNPMLSAVEQMGMKLDPQKDQVEMLVIDHIEKTPTEN